jgi:hypothetical protein
MVDSDLWRRLKLIEMSTFILHRVYNSREWGGRKNMENMKMVT